MNSDKVQKNENGKTFLTYEYVSELHKDRDHV